MDLSTLIGDTILYIRVAGIIKTPKGYLFEKKPDRDYLFSLGGKLVINEDSEEGLKREIFEEIGFKVNNLHLSAIIENFFTSKRDKVHEICFVYKVEDVFMDTVPEGFIEVSDEDLRKYEIKPSPIISLIESDSTEVKHIVLK